jgi:hypothetical protein
MGRQATFKVHGELQDISGSFALRRTKYDRAGEDVVHAK